MVPTVSLEGDALRGVQPDLLPQQMLAALPRQVKLGRKRQKARPPALRLSAYMEEGRMQTPPPQSTNWRAKAVASLARMYCNDELGCCVISGKAHSVGLWSGNESGTPVQATDDEIRQQYRSVCGPGDNGCYITGVLDVMRSRGLQAGGKLYKIDGYCSCDWTNKLEVQVALAIFGACTVGINLPEEWTRKAVWDDTSSQIVGGHDVSPIDYDERGVYVSSWGRVYLITWSAFTSRRWVEEFYVMLAPSWYDRDNVAPSGIAVDVLRADLDKLARGEIPDPGGTGPPPPPPPGPTPPRPLFNLTLPRDVPRGSRVWFTAPLKIPAARYGVVPDPAHLALSVPWTQILHMAEHLVRTLGPAAVPVLEAWLATAPLPPFVKAALQALVEQMLGGAADTPADTPEAALQMSEDPPQEVHAE